MAGLELVIKATGKHPGAIDIVRILTGWIPFIVFIITLVLLLPSLAVTVRKLHDTNRTGWWLLLPIVLTVVGLVVGVSLIFTDLLILGVALSVLRSVVGFVALLVFLIQPGNLHPNQYGPYPIQQRVEASGMQVEGHPYASSPPAGDYSARGFDSEAAQSFQHGEAGQRRYCSQCGLQLQPEGRPVLHGVRHGGVIWTTLVLRASLRVAKPALAGRQPA